MSTHGTDDPKKTQHLLSLEGAEERLHLVEANLLEEGSFDSVVDGCDGVFHMASAVLFPTTDPQVTPIRLITFANQLQVSPTIDKVEMKNKTIQALL